LARASRPCEGGVVGTFPEAMPPYEGGGAGVRRKRVYWIAGDQGPNQGQSQLSSGGVSTDVCRTSATRAAWVAALCAEDASKRSRGCSAPRALAKGTLGRRLARPRVHQWSLREPDACFGRRTWVPLRDFTARLGADPA